MTESLIHLALLYGAFVAAAVAFLAARRMMRTRRSVEEKSGRLTERYETISNYNKLASVRIADAKNTVTEHEIELAELERERRELLAESATPPKVPLSLFHVFDRYDARKEKVFEFTVESVGDSHPWTGTRTYVVSAPSLEQATARIRDRFSPHAGYRTDEGQERKSF